MVALQELARALVGKLVVRLQDLQVHLHFLLSIEADLNIQKLSRKCLHHSGIQKATAPSFYSLSERNFNIQINTSIKKTNTNTNTIIVFSENLEY